MSKEDLGSRLGYRELRVRRIRHAAEKIRMKRLERGEEAVSKRVAIGLGLQEQGRELLKQVFEYVKIPPGIQIDGIEKLGDLFPHNYILTKAFQIGHAGIILGSALESIEKWAVEGTKDNDSPFIDSYNSAIAGLPIAPFTQNDLKSFKENRPDPEKETNDIRRELSTEKGKTFLGFIENENKLPWVIRGFMSSKKRLNTPLKTVSSVYKAVI